ncbi:Putative bifunctional polynucleotide kinase/RNA ligase [Habropoda laboriosa]|uniref:Putative bifunctional polynucleotide kinase/RNA ligase n=1 Tax=Habropoda laboriosa TaxID=597456 RepID=A0A0L7QJ17_9HYME|nr:Putative bifunctional polynucleotide kinase/RNA ligase [Habropoda laboriosa]
MLDFDRELVLSLWTSKGTISYWNQFITNKGADGFKKVLRDYIEYFNDSLELKKFLKEIGDEKECTPCQIRKARNFPLLYKTLAKDVATWEKMRIDQALKSGEITLDYLKNELNILVKESGDYIVLNYIMTLSPKDNPYVKQCRGIILNKHTFDVVCLPFDRFFNYGENQSGLNLDWKNNKVDVMEKVDGSLIKIWFDNRKWNISTRGTVYCNTGDLCLSGLTFEKLVLSAFGVLSVEDFQDNFSDAKKNLTHIFELTSPQNRVVTDYGSKPCMHYLASRNKETGEYSRENFYGVKYREAKWFKLNTVEDCLKASVELKGLEEGFVVYVNDVPEFKIKSPQYVAVSHIRGEGLTSRRISELVLINEHEEYLNYFPEDAKYFTTYLNKYDEIISDIDTNLNKDIRQAWIDRGKENGYHVVIKNFDTSLEECIKRDKERTNTVGMTVIMKQWKMFVKYRNMYMYSHDENLTNCIIVDIDGNTMKFTPTIEQQNIINHCLSGKDLAVKAYAGASKTTTLSMVSKELDKQGKRGLYLAFNKNTATEAKGRMASSVDCLTVHGLAYRNTDPDLIRKLSLSFINSNILAERLSTKGVCWINYSGQLIDLSEEDHKELLESKDFNPYTGDSYDPEEEIWCSVKGGYITRGEWVVDQIVPILHLNEEVIKYISNTMKFTPTIEQQNIINHCLSGKDLAVKAYAGASKTTTLSMVSKELDKQGKRGLYLAFNKNTATEAKGRMASSVDCLTVHGLAYRNTDPDLIRKLSLSFINSNILAERLSTKGVWYEVFFRGERKRKLVKPASIIFLAKETIKKFCNSDETIDNCHVVLPEIGKGRFSSGKRDIEIEVLKISKRYWKEMIDTNNDVPITHDVYLKLFSLSGIQLNNYDYIMGDEWQDSNPCTTAWFDSQKVQKIVVGDDYQQIYQWRGSVNALQSNEDVDVLYLTKTFRFGGSICDRANQLLKHRDAPLPLIGNGSEVYHEEPEFYYCYISRTNCSCLETFTTLMENNDQLKVHLNIDVKDVSNFANHWFSLEERKFPKVTHPQLIGFNNTQEVKEYLDENKDKDLDRYVQLVSKFGKKLFFILKNVVDLNEADCIVTTCHKVKGLEFDTVFIDGDFDLIDDEGDITEDEMLLNLAYVAVTRGKKYVNSESMNSFFNTINKE